MRRRPISKSKGFVIVGLMTRLDAPPLRPFSLRDSNRPGADRHQRPGQALHRGTLCPDSPRRQRRGSGTGAGGNCWSLACLGDLLTSTPTAAPTQVQARDSMLNDGRAAVEISRLKQSVHAEKSAREEAFTALLANIQRFVPEPAHKGVCDRPRNAVNNATPFTRSLF